MKVNSSCAIELKQNICVSVYLCMCTCVYLLLYVNCLYVFVHVYLCICICVFVRVNRKEGEPCSKVNESCASKSKQRAPKLTWNIHGWDILSHIQTANIPTPQNKNHHSGKSSYFPPYMVKAKAGKNQSVGFIMSFTHSKSIILHSYIFVSLYFSGCHFPTEEQLRVGKEEVERGFYGEF